MPRRSINPGGGRALTPRKPAPLARPDTFAGSVLKYLDKGDVKEAVQVLRDGMKATKNEKCGRFTYVETPDFGTRMTAARMILEYTFGKPNMVLQVQAPDDPAQTREESASELAKKLKSSNLDIDDIIDAYTLAATPAVPVDDPGEGDPS